MFYGLFLGFWPIFFATRKGREAAIRGRRRGRRGDLQAVDAQEFQIRPFEVRDPLTESCLTSGVGGASGVGRWVLLPPCPGAVGGAGILLRTATGVKPRPSSSDSICDS
jgi:hypothetical protein